MRLFHLADVHLGAAPDAGTPWAQERAAAIRRTFIEVVEEAERQQADYLVISGDLFHHQPLLRELKEVDSVFARLSHTVVVLIAGNHDFITPESAYATYKWTSRVVFFRQENFAYARIPGTDVYFYGRSYHRQEIAEPLFDGCRPLKREGVHILVAHGGDARHVPMDMQALSQAGFDYVALGHLHKRSEGPGPLFNPGSLEPLDHTETGRHGYYEVILGTGTRRVRFCPAAAGAYVDLEVPVTARDTAYTVEQRIRSLAQKAETVAAEELAGHVPELYYNVKLTGVRDPQITFDEDEIRRIGRVASVTDATGADLDLEGLAQDHRQDMLGRYIAAFEGKNDDISRRALELGVRTLLETQRTE
ncbi:MAG: DNA repair exonuclease [Lachnospiraceae bacterium]|nr:DNA repair exonuclease [Lachnospiraceae bacterium]